MNLEPWVDGAISRVPPKIREAFALDPLSAMTDHLGLKVRAVDSLSERRNDGGFCDGMSFLNDGVVLYAPTENRRQNFTLAHEFGHLVVSRDTGVFDWISDQDDAEILLETICDRIAQRLLLPDDLTRSIIGSGPVRAHHVRDLVENSQASYPACAIGIARQIRGLGAVVLIDLWKKAVYHASIKPDADDGWPVVYPWRDQVLPDAHALLNISPGDSLTRRISWRSSWGREAEFWADAVVDDKRVVAILSDVDLWNSEPGRVLGPREYDARPLRTIYCCNQKRQVRGYPCPTCRQQFCPSCGKCRCDRNATSEVKCHGCFMLKQAHLVVENLCDSCRA